MPAASPGHPADSLEIGAAKSAFKGADPAAELKMNDPLGTRSGSVCQKGACDPANGVMFEAQAPFTAPRNGACASPSPPFVASVAITGYPARKVWEHVANMGAISQTLNLVHLASNPIPNGGRVGDFTTTDAVRLRYALFPRLGEKPARGTVVLVQGRTEFIEKYFETIGDFQKRGFCVATFDLRGQGGSDRLIANPVLGYVEHFDDYWTDLRDFHARIVLPDCPPPYYLVGHSTGGLIGLLAAARDRLMFDRVFLTSPMVSLPGLPLSLKWSSRLVNMARFLGFSRLPVGRKEDRALDENAFTGNPLTSDKARYMRSVEVLEARPDLFVGFPTLAWIGSALAAMRRANADDFPQTLKIPVFICAAACDSVVETRASEALGLRLRAGHHVVIAGARHELFMESDPIREQVFAAFDAFVTEQSE